MPTNDPNDILPDDMAPQASENLDLEAELQALRNELQDANDRALRSSAELDAIPGVTRVEDNMK